MKKILLTGSTGFIGKNIKELLPDKYELFCPTHSELDLMDGNAVRRFIEDKEIGIVIHAATLNTTKQQVSPADVLKHNLTMFYNLERCHDLYEKMLYFGSGAEYDRTMGGTCSITEEDFDRSIPQDSYSLSKYVMAKHAEASENIYDLCLFGTYGKYEEKERRFISNMIFQAKSSINLKSELQAGEIKCGNAQTQSSAKMIMYQNAVYDYLWVEDLIPILEWFIENKPKYHRYNVCSGRREELINIAKLVKQVVICGVKKVANQKAEQIIAQNASQCDCKSDNRIEEKDSALNLEINPDIEIIVEKDGMNSEYTASNERLKKEMQSISFTSVECGVENLYNFLTK
ncbi:MAG: NAD-dependent epimerase/dehydratase family protein [Lachnospiraceae bacterium]|nr:NAD-dependent epimerase/dehydratase family protein [Lachnospiraceae bacterium]